VLLGKAAMWAGAMEYAGSLRAIVRAGVFGVFGLV
jgi:hypothetical protein